MFSLRQSISRKSVVQVFQNSCSPVYGCARLPHPGTMHDTLWQTNIATENGQLQLIYLLENWKWWFSNSHVSLPEGTCICIGKTRHRYVEVWMLKVVCKDEQGIVVLNLPVSTMQKHCEHCETLNMINTIGILDIHRSPILVSCLHTSWDANSSP